MTTPPPSAAHPVWLPLADGDLAAAAWEAIAAIAVALAPGAAAPPQGATPPDVTLATGDAGRALFFAYLAQHLDTVPATSASSAAPDPAMPAAAAAAAAVDPAAAAMTLIERAVAGLAPGPAPAGLALGLPGVGWVAEHLRGRLYEQEAAAYDEVDHVILAWLDRPVWQGGLDLLGGLTGLGTYAVERLPRPAAVRALTRAVEHLAAAADLTAEGAAWLTPAERLPPAAREAFPLGCFDLGVAHGAAGIVALLAAARAAGVAAGPAERLLDAAVRRLLAGQRRATAAAAGRFPHRLAPDGSAPEGPSRLAWCYGDLGIAAVLALAARAARRPDWLSAAADIALAAAARPAAASGVVDAGLCHGAAGVAHLFARLHVATGSAALADAARGWLRRALDLRSPGLGPGGFASWADTAAGGTWCAEGGFLTGAAGVGLALLGAVSPVDPAWDRVLALSLRGD